MVFEGSIAELHSVVRKILINGDGTESSTYFSGTIQSDVVKDLTFVPAYDDPANPVPTVLNARMEEGYQRAGNSSRMRAFANFLDGHPTSLVPPVILSTRGKWIFSSQDNIADFGSLEVLEPAAVMDGQHRLGGYVVKFQNDGISMPINFIAIHDLSVEEEMREFAIINSSQSRVSPSLIAAIGVLADGDEDAWIALQIDEREDSPFHRKIGHQKTGPEHLFNLAMVTKNVKRTFGHGGFLDSTPEEKVEIFIQYWDAIKAAHPDEWADVDVPRRSMQYKLLEGTGFIAWSHVGSEVLSQSLDTNSNAIDVERIEELISRVAGRIDWLKDGKYAGRTGEVGGGVIRRDLERCLAGE